MCEVRILIIRPERRNPFRVAPRVDVAEDQKNVTLTAELPSVKESHIDVSLKGDKLTIKGGKRSEHDEKKEMEGHTVHRVERS